MIYAVYKEFTDTKQDAESTLADKKLSGRRLSAIRRAQLRDVARHRIESENGCDVATFATCFALILGESPEGFYKFKPTRGVIYAQWPGLDINTLRRELRDLGLDPTEEILEDAIHRAQLRPTRKISSIVSLTYEERKKCKAWNLGLRRPPMAKKVRAIGTSRSTLYRRMAAMGLSTPPRVLKPKPWMDLGISRATWFRRRKAALPVIETTSPSCDFEPDTTFVHSETPYTIQVEPDRGEPVSAKKNRQEDDPSSRWLWFLTMIATAVQRKKANKPEQAEITQFSAVKNADKNNLRLVVDNDNAESETTFRPSG